MSKYDIIIIGSGLGGLECGAILSKEGYHVCVLEKNELFGGCFQTYQRGGHRMDTGIHYIGSLDEGQIMNQYFRYFGIMDKLSIQRMDEEGFDRIYYKNAIYDYAMGHERFMETLCHSFPHERENLKRYVAAIRSVGNLISTDHLKKGRLSQEGMDFFATSAAGMIIAPFKSSNVCKKKIVSLLTGPPLYIGTRCANSNGGNSSFNKIWLRNSLFKIIPILPSSLCSSNNTTDRVKS